MGWVAKIFRVGRVVEPAAPLPAAIAEPPAGVRGSLQIRHVDAGSCNGCEVEISGAFGPVYDAERFGARLVRVSVTERSSSTLKPALWAS